MIVDTVLHGEFVRRELQTRDALFQPHHSPELEKVVAESAQITRALDEKRPLRVYLAGPNVFFPHEQAYFEQQKEICKQHGFEGIAPSDNQPDLRLLKTPTAIGLAIYRADRESMEHCDLMIGNITPWHPHPDDPQQRPVFMDTGTAIEIGHMGKDKPVFLYSTTATTLEERLKDFLGHKTHEDTKNHVERDSQGFMVETTTMRDNLMIDGTAHHSGGAIVVTETPPLLRYIDLQSFEAVVKIAAARFKAIRASRDLQPLTSAMTSNEPSS